MQTDLKIVGHQMMLLPRKNTTVLRYMCDCPRNQRHPDSASNKSARPRRIYSYLQTEATGEQHQYYVTEANVTSDGQQDDQPMFVLSSTNSNPAELKLIHLEMHGNLQQCNASDGVQLSHQEGISEELQRLQLGSELCCPVIVCEHVDDIGGLTDVQAEIDFRQSQARIGTLARLEVPTVDIADEKRRPPLPEDTTDQIIETWWRG